MVKRADLKDENILYYLLRRSIISFFANEERLSREGLDVADFRIVSNFARDLYYEHCKNREDVQKCVQ